MAKLGPLRTGTLVYAVALALWGWFAIKFHRDEGPAITSLALSGIAMIIGTAFLTRSKHRVPSIASKIQKRAWIMIAVIGAGPIITVALWLGLVLALVAMGPLAEAFSSLFFPFSVAIFFALPALMIFTLYPLFTLRERIALTVAGGLLLLTIIAEIISTQLYSTAWLIGLALTSIAAVTACLLALINPANRPPVPDVLGTPLDLSGTESPGQLAAAPQERPYGPTHRR